ncbi:MFS transporter [Mucilaginibacter angelicae]|uniref:Lysosomal dipeptide transporter MFSD1 n=1 Tax=Mucilaginibacter angelicae TaxID=869718 RepID=A0ABV6L2X0_9SPHI
MDNALPSEGSLKKGFIIAWFFGLIFYFLEYVIRSSPAVMLPGLSGAFGVNALRVSAVLGTYYYTYSVTSLIAGVALDRSGAKYPVAAGLAILAIGCVLFAIPNVLAGDAGRLLQGAGSAFAFTGCVYLASHGFAPRFIATAIGLTQCIGMLGGFAGQFVAGPLIQHGVSVHTFWIGIGLICGATCLLLFYTTPKENKGAEYGATSLSLLKPYKVVFTNVQSYLSGILSGLLFAPTTIFAMTWGVAFFQKDRLFDYDNAVLTCSMVPLGWVLGCPLLGWISDKLGKRKPVLSGGILIMLLSFAQLIFMPSLIPGYISMFIFGTASGAAMIPYTIIKEANPDNVKGSATGGINFLTFGVTALLGPVFASLYGKSLGTATDHLLHFRNAGIFFLITTAIALVVSLVIKETGRGAEKR